MKTFAALVFVVLLGGAVVTPAMSEPSQDQAAVAFRNFDVFVDPPTGYTFVKLPSGWKFVGKVEQSELGDLPPTVLTSLLPRSIDEPDSVEIRAEIRAAKVDATR